MNRDPLTPSTHRNRPADLLEPRRGVSWTFVGEMVGAFICIAVIGFVVWKVMF